MVADERVQRLPFDLDALVLDKVGDWQAGEGSGADHSGVRGTAHSLPGTHMLLCGWM